MYRVIHMFVFPVPIINIVTYCEALRAAGKVVFHKYSILIIIIINIIISIIISIIIIIVIIITLRFRIFTGILPVLAALRKKSYVICRFRTSFLSVLKPIRQATFPFCFVSSKAYLSNDHLPLFRQF